jgi:hypothetical protein
MRGMATITAGVTSPRREEGQGGGLPLQETA